MQGVNIIVEDKKSWHSIADPAILSLEVKKLRSLLGVTPDAVKLHQDSWGLKKLVSYMIRKAGKDKDAVKDPKRRDPFLKF